MTNMQRAWSNTVVAFIAVLAAAFPSAGAAEARTYCVSTTGNDDHAGTEAEPLLTIQRAADRARAGDTIVLRGGVYAQTVVLRFSGEEGKPITLSSRKGERAVIQPAEKGQRPPSQAVLLQSEAGYQHAIGWINIEGLEIRHGYDGVKMYNAHDVVLRDCRIHDSWNQGILASGNRVLIDRNMIAGSGRDPKGDPSLKHGIYATGTAFTITNNVIHSNSAYGIQVAAYDYKPGEMAGPEYAEAKDWLIANNTLAFNKVSAGIVLWQDGVENCQILNNIFYKNGGSNGIVFYTQKGRRHVVRNNIFFPPGDNLASTEPDTHQAADNREVDPLFTDPKSFDFHIKPGSPAIDAGADLASRRLKNDFEGDARPQGKGFDIGADELGTGASAKAAKGPLRVHPDNPRHFTDGSGRAVYLTGIQYEDALREDGTPVATPVDYAAFLDTVGRYNLNFVRLWRWSELFRYRYEDGEPFATSYMPWKRLGPGTALDGRPRFDLTQFDPAYFDRLRSRVQAAAERGLYVSVMLFEGHALRFSKPPWRWDGHPFNKGNNVNGVDSDPDGDGMGLEVHTLKVPAVTAVQEAYLRKVIDTLNDLDNVLYEVANETGPHSTEWQYHVVRFVHDYERGKAKQHPVGMSFQYPAGTDRALFDSPADWVAPAEGYRDDPPAGNGKKVVLSDTDHLGGKPLGKGWVWQSFLRGLNPVNYGLMGLGRLLDKPVELEEAARAMGQTRRYAERMNLSAMKPVGELASTKFCLADPPREYLIYLPAGGAATVDLSGAKGDLAVEWFDPAQDKTIAADGVSGGAKRELKPPFEGPAVLHLSAKAK
jgi:hypothetical protein